MSFQNSSALYERQKAVAMRLGEKLGTGALFSKSQLRQFQPIIDGTNNYTFGFIIAQQLNDAQQLLLQNDVFLATDIRMVLMSRITAKPAALKTYLYPNFDEFQTVNGAVARDLEVLYNSNLNIMQEVTNVVPTISTKVFRQPNQTQQTAAANNTDQQMYSDGFIPLEPFVILGGQRQIDINVTIPSVVGLSLAAATAGRENLLAIELEGFLFKGAAIKLQDIVNKTKGMAV